MNPRQRSETNDGPLGAVGVAVSGVDESSSEVGNCAAIGMFAQNSNESGVDESSSEVGNQKPDARWP